MMALGSRRFEGLVTPPRLIESINAGAAVPALSDIDLTASGTRLCRGIYVGTGGTISVTYIGLASTPTRVDDIPVTDFQDFPGFINIIHDSTASNLYAVF